MPSSSRCIHLHCHSHFSLLDGNPRVKDLVQAAASAGMDALALTDHGNLFGIIELIREARSAGIKPIPGIEAYIARKDRKDRSGRERGNFTDHITLLAQNDVGYRNLLKLTSKSFIEGMYRKPRIDKALLDEHREGIIALSGCLSGEVARAVLHGNEDDAAQAAGTFREILGKENFFLEVMNNGLEAQARVREALRLVSAKTGIPLVATSDVHYLRQSDSRAQEVQLCIGTGTTLEDPSRMRMESDQFYFRTPEDLQIAFADMPDALARTAEIADRCRVELKLGEMHLPQFTPDDGSTPEVYFRRLCEEGLLARYGAAAQAAARARMEQEIAVIQQMGFVSYFLIVSDFIRYARQHSIPVGPGRGSAAGSLVAYVLGITSVDPLKYDLLFERFLNSSRISMPDIDIDFCRDGREKVIEYVRQRYGSDRVSQIVTFGTMAAKAAIRDVGRVLHMDLQEIDRIAKKIPGTPGTKLKDALEDSELEAIRDSSDSHRDLFDIALKIEGLNRHASTHAAGVVIGDQPLMEIVPLCTVQGELNTQFTMNDLEELGLLKMDFLGLKTLTIMDVAAKNVLRNHAVQLDYDSLALNDAKTYELLQRGETVAVFQLESAGMRELLIKMGPNCFEDIIAILALYRPGPLGSGMVESYVNRKRGVEKVRYPHPALEGILQETYGILVYQEQVMRIANVLAGFSLNDADTLRKAMGKKKPEVMAKFRQSFIEGAVRNQCREELATEIWETMEYFAGYGFNKSHSTAYGLITYATAYLKANYPREFMAAVITAEVSNSDKVASYLAECRRMGIPVLPPDLVRSEAHCTTEEQAIRMGLATIKGVGDKAIESLVEARQPAGNLQSLEDLFGQISLQAVNRAAFEALIKAGAFDSSGHSRASIFAALDPLLQEAARTQKDRRAGQKSLFADAQTEGVAKSTIPPLPEWPERDLLRFEKEVFGFYLSSNPLFRYADLLHRHSSIYLSQVSQLTDGASVTVSGIVAKIRITTTKKGKSAGRKMAIFELQGVDGVISCVVFPDTFERVRDAVQEDRIVLATGQVDLSRDEPSLKVQEIRTLESLLSGSKAGQLILDLPDKPEDLRPLLSKIREELGKSPGTNPVFVRLERPNQSPLVHRLAPSHWITICDDLVANLESLLGEGSTSLH